MTIQTLFVALPFRRTPDGHWTAHEARECASSEHAAAEATTLASQYDGAIAFARDMDSSSGTAAAHLIRSVGDVPRLDYLLG